MFQNWSEECNSKNLIASISIFLFFGIKALLISNLNKVKASQINDKLNIPKHHRPIVVG